MGNVFTVTLPDIGEGVVEGEVIEWLKNVGDPVQQDEAVVVVMTDKATVELPSPHPGKLLKQHFAAGEVAYLDRPLYDLDVGAVEVAEHKEEVPVIVEKKETVATRPGAALPSTRKLARDLGIKISSLQGTGPGGRVTDQDLLQTKAATPPLSLPDSEAKPITGIKNLMAKKMVESKQTAPHFSYFERVDATRLVQLRENFKAAGANESIRVTYMPFFIRALSLTIAKHPAINSSVDLARNEQIFHKEQNIGVAMTTPQGLIVPVLHGVQSMSLEEIIRAYAELCERARDDKLAPNEMKGSTISISNFGVLGGGGRWATPIINYPEVAILAVARIFKEPVVKNDQVVVRETMNLSWSFDHRVIDGNIAAACSYDFSRVLCNPGILL